MEHRLHRHGRYSPWELTPRWMFWRKKWRRCFYGPWDIKDDFWEYANELEVAKCFLKETFSDA